jgi:hypothetical protein
VENYLCTVATRNSTVQCVQFGGGEGPPNYGPLTRARILKHLLEAEKSTFREELSFPSSESTTWLVNRLQFLLNEYLINLINFNKLEKWS